MNIAGLLFLLIAHYISGRGLIRLCRVQLEAIPAFCLAMLCGVPLLALAPCMLQLAGLTITATTVVICIAVITCVCSIPLLVNFRKPRFVKPGLPGLYELPFIIALGLLMALSVWRCFYYPAYARDMITGPELIAEYTVLEGTMINSVFNIDLSTTNNHFKSPYITGLQIVYKLLVHPFGQLWLSVLSVSFVIWLYWLLRRRIHAILAGLLLLFFVTVPELYAYTYVVLYDFSNMIFFFAGFYFLTQFTRNDRRADLLFSAVLFGMATYIRTETLILVAMITPVLMGHFYRHRYGLKKAALRLGVFVGVPVLFYLICIPVFVRQFVPVPFTVASQLNPNLADISVLFKRFWDIQDKLIFSSNGMSFFGYFIFFFYTVLLIDLVWLWRRRLSPEALMCLYGIAVVFTGLAVIGYLLPLADLLNTTKRGIFKALPLMLLYLANSTALQWLAGWLKKWEFYEGKEKAPPVKAKVASQRKK